jgi:hypothetical protein
MTSRSRFSSIIVCTSIALALGLSGFARGWERKSGDGPERTDQSSIRVPILEAYPDEIQTSIELRGRQLKRLPPTRPEEPRPDHFIDLSRRWAPGQTVRVAFRGGDKIVHKKISDAAQEWQRHGNLKLEFGQDQQTGEFRKWSETDKIFNAEIRISFV